MPEEITDVQAADSSAAETQDVSATESSAVDQDVNSAASSDADRDVTAADSPTAEGAKEESPLEIVEKALTPEESPPSEKQPGDAEESAETKDEEKSDGDLPEDPTDEELEAFAPKTRKRVEQLLDARNGLKKQVGELEPKAQQWDEIEAFRQANGMKPEHVSNAIQIAALIENDPQRAFKVVDHLHRALAERTGESLQSDLAEAVKRGEITREHAFELSRARATSTVSQQQRDAEALRRQEVEQQTAIDQQVENLRQVSTKWDQKKLQSDPDWNLKRTAVAERMEARLHREGFPKDARGMVDLLEQELQKVESFVSNFRPKAKPITPTPQGASARQEAPRKAKDHYELVDIALGG